MAPRMLTERPKMGEVAALLEAAPAPDRATHAVQSQSMRRLTAREESAATRHPACLPPPTHLCNHAAAHSSGPCEGHSQQRSQEPVERGAHQRILLPRQLRAAPQFAAQHSLVLVGTDVLQRG